MQLRKMIGGVLIVAGTSIGGGMLGLPIVTAPGGIVYATVLLLLSWALMTFAAFLTLEVNLCFPKNSNMISMMAKTLGPSGTIIGWTVYILFLYALLAAYISGGQDLLRGLLALAGIHIPVWLSGAIFVVVFGAIVMKGVHWVDKGNRLFMTVKLGALFLLIIFAAFHLSNKNYLGHWRALAPAVTVAITSFGFSIVVPSLRNYFDSDVVTLRKVILYGSLLPLVCYIIWVGVILSTIPLHGKGGLLSIMHSGQPLMALLHSLNTMIHSRIIEYLSRIFTSVCVLTAFLCVSLGLSDYVADGVGKEKKGMGFWIIAAITFVPPFACVIFYPRAFIYFLSLAGLLCVILQGFLPALMSWRVRYQQKYDLTYRVFGGKGLILLAMLGAILVAVLAVQQLS